jgi:hypothetical protein
VFVPEAGCAHALDSFLLLFIMLMNECAGGRGSMPCMEEGKPVSHSIRNLSAYHV